jgi:hypothetical protein
VSASPTPEPGVAPGSDETSRPTSPPNFSACEGLTGLENAICRHQALLGLHASNPGLQQSLSRLQRNLAAHEARGHDRSPVPSDVQHGGGVTPDGNVGSHPHGPSAD